MNLSPGYAAYEAQAAAVRALEAEATPGNKAALFDTLAAAGIGGVGLTFAGKRPRECRAGRHGAEGCPMTAGSEGRRGWPAAGREHVMETTGMQAVENPNVTYKKAQLWCDRDGVLGIGTDLPDSMLPIACAPWLRFAVAATGLALRSRDGTRWIVPEARGDADAAMDAVWEFRKGLLLALAQPARTRRNAP